MAKTIGTSTDITFTSLNGLTAGNWAASAQVDLSTSDAQDCLLGGWLQTDAAGWTDTTRIDIYVTAPHDKAYPTTTIGGSVGTGLAGTDSTVTESGGGAFMQQNLIFFTDVYVDADATKKYYVPPLSLAHAFNGALPTHFQVLVHLADTTAGKDLDATDGGQFMYTTIEYA